jgi:hypothetical protein
MTREELIRMARESGAAPYTNRHYPDRTTHTFSPNQLEAFAALIAAVEREACAKVCEAGVDYEHPTVKGHIMENFGHSRLLAKAIRARGQA